MRTGKRKEKKRWEKGGRTSSRKTGTVIQSAAPGLHRLLQMFIESRATHASVHLSLTALRRDATPRRVRRTEDPPFSLPRQPSDFLTGPVDLYPVTNLPFLYIYMTLTYPYFFLKLAAFVELRRKRTRSVLSRMGKYTRVCESYLFADTIVSEERSHCQTFD